MKKLALCTITVLTTMSIASTAFASQGYKNHYNKIPRYALKDAWVIHDNSWSYINSNGSVTTGWKKILDHWFYFDSDGKMVKNRWVDKYYIDSSGIMLTDTITPDGYKVGADGKRVSDSNADNVKLDEARAATTLDKHEYYKYCSQEQANQADAVARSIAIRVLSDSSLITDLAKIKKAASIIYREYITGSSSENDANKYYRSPYGVFVARIGNCAGGTRALGRVLDFMGYDWEHANPNTWTYQWCIVNMDGQIGYADAMGYGCGFGTHPFISGDMSKVNEDIANGLY